MGDETRGKTAPRIFVSYSHEDAEWLEALTTHLDPLGGDLDLWADTRLQAGDLWREEIETALGSAQAAVFLVSPDFLKSRFIRDHELPALLEKAERGGLRVLSLHARPSAMAGSAPLKEIRCAQGWRRVSEKRTGNKQPSAPAT